MRFQELRRTGCKFSCATSCSRTMLYCRSTNSQMHCQQAAFYYHPFGLDPASADVQPSKLHLTLVRVDRGLADLPVRRLTAPTSMPLGFSFRRSPVRRHELKIRLQPPAETCDPASARNVQLLRNHCHVPHGGPRSDSVRRPAKHDVFWTALPGERSRAPYFAYCARPRAAHLAARGPDSPTQSRPSNLDSASLSWARNNNNSNNNNNNLLVCIRGPQKALSSSSNRTFEPLARAFLPVPLCQPICHRLLSSGPRRFSACFALAAQLDNDWLRARGLHLAQPGGHFFEALGSPEAPAPQRSLSGLARL